MGYYQIIMDTKTINKDIIWCECGLPLQPDGSCKRKHKSKTERKEKFRGFSKFYDTGGYNK